MPDVTEMPSAEFSGKDEERFVRVRDPLRKRVNALLTRGYSNEFLRDAHAVVASTEFSDDFARFVVENMEKL